MVEAKISLDYHFHLPFFDLMFFYDPPIRFQSNSLLSIESKHEKGYFLLIIPYF